jgi:dienelactone hydrolase
MTGIGEKRAELARLLGGFAPIDWAIVDRRPHAVALSGVRCEQLVLRAGDGAQARAFLTGPATSWRDLPAVVYCHAHGDRHHIGAVELIDGRPALLDPPYAEALAEAGIVAICIDLPCFGERADESESAAAKRHLWGGTTLFGRMLSELAGLPGVLAVAGGVDPRRVGAMGVSMGATLAFWLAALDERIRAVAHLCCFADLARLVETGSHDLHGLYMTVPGLLPRFTTGEIAGMAAPRPQLVCLGADDPLTPADAARKAIGDARAAYDALGVGARFEAVVAPGVGHRETPAMRARVVAFLRSAL